MPLFNTSALEFYHLKMFPNMRLERIELKWIEFINIKVSWQIELTTPVLQEVTLLYINQASLYHIPKFVRQFYIGFQY